MSLLRSAIPRLHLTASSARAFHAAAPAFNAASTPAPTSSSTSGASGARDLPAEQKGRQTEPVAADLINDAPPELHQRPVRIYKPAKTACSTGNRNTSSWRVDFDVLQGSGRWENPLMGWASSADYMQGTSLKFNTKESAIHFCEKQNWPYFVQEPKRARIPPKAYASNYDYVPGKLRIHHTK